MDNGYAIWVNDDNTITVWETENGIYTNVYDVIPFPDGLTFSYGSLRMFHDKPYAVELWYEDHDGGINKCMWFHLF